MAVLVVQASLLCCLLCCFSAAPSVARSPVPDTQQGSAGVWRELECDTKRKESALPDWNPMKKNNPQSECNSLQKE